MCQLIVSNQLLHTPHGVHGILHWIQHNQLVLLSCICDTYNCHWVLYDLIPPIVVGCLLASWGPQYESDKCSLYVHYKLGVDCHVSP
jgi:hypothetical protein